MLGGIAFPVLLVCTDGDIAVYRSAAIEHGLDPLLERAKLELPCAPPGLSRRQEVVVLLQPEVEVPVWVEPKDGLA